ncbi:MAG: hypothetical protein ACJ73N_05615 [Bryobacteraceae bacterium]
MRILQITSTALLMLSLFAGAFGSDRMKRMLLGFAVMYLVLLLAVCMMVWVKI